MIATADDCHIALRVSPVLPNNSRVANMDTMLPKGGGIDGSDPIFVPKGTMVSFSIFQLHRRKDLWGMDADLFRPERWDAEKDLKSWVCHCQLHAITRLPLTNHFDRNSFLFMQGQGLVLDVSSN